jgi:hypothetical protein
MRYRNCERPAAEVLRRVFRSGAIRPVPPGTLMGIENKNCFGSEAEIIFANGTAGREVRSCHEIGRSVRPRPCRFAGFRNTH